MTARGVAARIRAALADLPPSSNLDGGDRYWVEGHHGDHDPRPIAAADLDAVLTAAETPRGRREQWVVKGNPDTVVGTFYDQTTAEHWRDRVREHSHPEAYVEHRPAESGDGG